MNVKKYYLIGKNLLFPICRSLTGPGTRKTLKIIKKNFNKLKIHSDASGKKVFDWNIPPEWSIKKAYVLDKNKKKIIDYKENNLHIVNYSVPTKRYIYKKDLLKKFYSLPKQPKAIPYITSYYRKDWGFLCK